ncbi:hypothetical protein Fot_05036 [Forsythia ovata]|uniref:Uncharacterized protein n=1 Tax=Forsythia ovata TaxID=205694 RepID=A0ABD1T8V4_9LAMI
MHANVFILLTYLTEFIYPAGEVPSHLLMKKDFEVLIKLYAYKGDFSSISCSDHLFVKYGLMKRQGSNILPNIGLAGLAAKKIPPIVRWKEADKNQKKELVRLSLKSSEQTSAS